MILPNAGATSAELDLVALYNTSVVSVFLALLHSSHAPHPRAVEAKSSRDAKL